MRTHKLLGIVAGLVLLPFEANAQTHVYRVDGNVCHPWEGGDEAGDWERSASVGLTIKEVNAATGNEAFCPIQTGPEIIPTDDILYVAVSGATLLANADDIEVALFLHDEDSTDSCECDVDALPSGSFGTTAEYGGGDGHCDDNPCPGGLTPNDQWVAIIRITLIQDNATQDNELYIRLLSLYS